VRASLLAALVAAASCSRDPGGATPSAPPPPSRSAAAVPEAIQPPAATCTLAPIPLRRPAPRRLVAIGDLHGDLAATRAVLRLAGAIDDRDRWIGGDLVVVQTGDVLDRGDGEQAILDLLDRLEREAKVAGGAVVWLLGNHELMNGAGDFRYVTPGGFADFLDAPGVDPARSPVDTPQPGVRARAAALLVGGPYARLLSGQNVVAIVGDSVFSHAGILPSHADAASLEAMNLASRCWLAGRGPQPAVLEDQDGPAWTRAYGGDPVDCDALGRALDALGARRMVVGHTVQTGGISSACDGRLWRIDVGLAAVYGGPIQALAIASGTGGTASDTGVEVLDGRRTAR